MHLPIKRKLVAAATVVAAAAFGGGAYAATQSSAPSRQAFLNDVAKRLNVSPAQLTNALKGAFDDQLQAAVAAGKLTQAQANAIKQRIQKRGSAPLGFGALRHPAGPGFFRGSRGGPGGLAALAALARRLAALAALAWAMAVHSLSDRLRLATPIACPRPPSTSA